MNDATPTRNTTGEDPTVTVPTVLTEPEVPEVPEPEVPALEVPEVELAAAAAVLEFAEDWDTREAARLALAAAAWVRAHPDQADDAPALVLAAAGLQPRVVWWPLVADAAATAVAVWGVASGRLAQLLDSTRWPHLMWLLAGAIALALLASDARDIYRCYRTIRHTRQTGQARVDMSEEGS